MKTVITSNTTKIAARYRSMARKLPGVVDRAIYDLTVQEAVPYFEKTVTTWTRQPRFTAQKTARGYTVDVNPAKPYQYVNLGTRPHIIEARNVKLLRFTGPYHAKTKPGVIASYHGGRGNVWVSKRRVHHPGIEARNFTDIILRRVQARAADKVRDAIKQASYGAGVGL